MNNVFCDKMKENPIIAGVKDIEKLDEVLESGCEIVFLLCGSIFNIKDAVERVKKQNKMIFIHVDLIDGFSKDATALRYIQEEIRPDGIISTKNNQLKVAKSLGLLTVQRIFVIDSLSFDTAVKSSKMINPDAVEIMPGIMPRITKQLSESLEVPVIVGGLISNEDEVKNAIESGALGVSSSSEKIWRMKL